MSAKSTETFLEVNGHEVRVSSPDKIVFPQAGLTKLDLVRYYLAVADGALRGAGGRPMVLKRFVKGISAEPFFQKRVPENHPDYIDTATLHYARGTSAEEAVVRDAAGLAWVVNLGCLDLNPHPVRAEDLDHPDELRVDLDPMPGVQWRQIVDVAMVAREVLDDYGLVGLAQDERIPGPAHPGADRAGVGLHAPSGSPPRPSPARSRTARPGSRRRAGGRRSAARACSSTSTRTRRTAPWHPRIPCARSPTRACRCRWTGTRSASGSPRSSRCRRCSSGSPSAATRTRGIDDAVGSLAGLLRLAEELGPAEKPPRGTSADGRRASTMPLIEVARTKTKSEALELLQTWKAANPEVAAQLHPADVLIDGMRGSSSLWYRVRINLQHVPEPERPAQGELLADYDPWAGKTWPGRP